MPLLYVPVFGFLMTPWLRHDVWIPVEISRFIVTVVIIIRWVTPPVCVQGVINHAVFALDNLPLWALTSRHADIADMLQGYCAIQSTFDGTRISQLPILLSEKQI